MALAYGFINAMGVLTATRCSLPMHLPAPAAAGGCGGAGAGVEGVLVMEPGRVKTVKTALEERGWVDKHRRICKARHIISYESYISDTTPTFKKVFPSACVARQSASYF
jgi:hypothetical protein